MIQLLYSPFPSIDSARAAARLLLEAKLVACCNLLPGIESHYWWDGALAQSAETILLCKTTPALAPQARQKLEALHPYECPAILSFSAEANPAFAHWVAAQTGDVHG